MMENSNALGYRKPMHLVHGALQVLEIPIVILTSFYRYFIIIQYSVIILVHM